jgi:hypothetical protein
MSIVGTIFVVSPALVIGLIALWKSHIGCWCEKCRPELHASPETLHWCQACDELVKQRCMEWTETGFWWCWTCTGRKVRGELWDTSGLYKDSSLLPLFLPKHVLAETVGTVTVRYPPPGGGGVARMDATDRYLGRR